MNKLTEYANKYGSDKGTVNSESHGFTEFYEHYFREIKNRVLANKEKIYVLEIGIWKGSSLMMLSEYFGKQNCEIYGLDIDLSNNEYSGKNIHAFTTDQNSIYELEKTAQENFPDVKFDIIIDDGGHFYNQQFNTLLVYHKYLKDDGIYILEDLHTSVVKNDEFIASPLYFLTTKQYPAILSPEQYLELLNTIVEVTIFRRENEKSSCLETSITSIIKFDNNRTYYKILQDPANEDEGNLEQPINNTAYVSVEENNVEHSS